MKLELKHLDFVNNGKVRLFNNLILYSKDVNLQDCKLGFDGNKQPYLMHENIPYYLDEIKPYKRSLSQLTQEIEHDGVRFVPMVELYKIAVNDIFTYVPDFHVTMIAHAENTFGLVVKEVISGERNGFTLNYPTEYEYRFEFQLSLNNEQKSSFYNLNQFQLFQKLQQWHFAIDIPSELYIEMEAIPTTKPNIA